MLIQPKCHARSWTSKCSEYRVTSYLGWLKCRISWLLHWYNCKHSHAFCFFHRLYPSSRHSEIHIDQHMLKRRVSLFLHILHWVGWYCARQLGLELEEIKTWCTGTSLAGKVWPLQRKKNKFRCYFCYFGAKTMEDSYPNLLDAFGPLFGQIGTHGVLGPLCFYSAYLKRSSSWHMILLNRLHSLTFMLDSCSVICCERFTGDVNSIICTLGCLANSSQIYGDTASPVGGEVLTTVTESVILLHILNWKTST